MIFTIGFVVMIISGIIGVINDRAWFNRKLDEFLCHVCTIGFLMSLFSFLTWAWKNFP